MFRIDVPRAYALLDLDTEPLFFSPELEIAIRLRGRKEWYTADQGVPSMRLRRAGKSRVGIWLPHGTKVDDIEGIRLRAIGDPGGWVNVVHVGPLTMLDDEFRAVHKNIHWKRKKALKTDGKTVSLFFNGNQN